jgi:hypothetical protein
VLVVACIRTGHNESAVEASKNPDGAVTTLCQTELSKLNENAALEQEPARKIRVTSSEKGKISTRKTDALLKDEQASWTRSSSPALKDSNSNLKSKSLSTKKGRSNSDILMTDSLYYVPNTFEINELSTEPEPGVNDGADVLGMLI